MAVLAAAQLLDELMGRNRNVAPNEKQKELNWEDPEFCPYFLVKFCPHDLFVNTRADLGACSKVHDEEVRKLFEQARPQKKLQYQEEFIRFCTSMINDVQRRIQKGKNRLALSGKSETPSVPSTQSHKNQEQIDLLDDKIDDLEAEAEKAGTNGNVEQAQGLMKLCDQLKDERDALKKQNESGHWSIELAQAQEKQMEVCEVCGAFLIVGDAQQRIDDHLSGKQHLGFSKLKTAITEISEIIQDFKSDVRRPARLSSVEKERKRERSRSPFRYNDVGERDRVREEQREFRREKDKVEKKEEKREKERKHDHDRRHHHHHHRNRHTHHHHHHRK